MPTDDPTMPTSSADEAIHRFRLLCSHLGSLVRRSGAPGDTPSTLFGSYSLIKALLSNSRNTRVPGFDSETLEVAWTSHNKSSYIAERLEHVDVPLEGHIDSSA
jgi:hypothetical protein